MYFDPTAMIPTDYIPGASTATDSTAREASMMICVKECPSAVTYPLTGTWDSGTGKVMPEYYTKHKAGNDYCEYGFFEDAEVIVAAEAGFDGYTDNQFISKQTDETTDGGASGPCPAFLLKRLD